MEFTPTQERHIGLYFRVSVFLKGLISLAEAAGGVLVLLVPASAVTALVAHWTQGELAEDPNDFVATHLLALAQQFSVASTVFISLYLLSRGLIKLLLVVALLKNQLWAYPLSLVVLGLFVLYQAYQIYATLSGVIIAVTAFDLVVMWFIWREYEVVRAQNAILTL